MVLDLEESQSWNLVGEVMVIARETDAMEARVMMEVNEGIIAVWVVEASVVV